MKLVVLFTCCALAAFGSTIFPGSPITSTGTPYTVTVSANDTTGADMDGLLITAHFTAGDELTCTWTVASTCTSAGGFTVAYPAVESTYPALFGPVNWTITNNRAGFTMDRITFNGLPGLIAFDRCMSGASTFNDTPGSFFDCLTEGTPNSNLGFGVATAGGGTGGITGTVQYLNALHLAATPAVGDLWGQFTITFGGTAFNNGNTFTFLSDSDELGSAVADVVATPEPSTLGMMGAALLAIGLKLRRR